MSGAATADGRNGHPPTGGGSRFRRTHLAAVASLGAVALLVVGALVLLP
ncbi:hypothetical protein ACFYQA_13390 [Streptomyces sp. NPDC005774]